MNRTIAVFSLAAAVTSTVITAIASTFTIEGSDNSFTIQRSGVTVDGTDVGLLSGPGWTYDADAKQLTLSAIAPSPAPTPPAPFPSSSPPTAQSPSPTSASAPIPNSIGRGHSSTGSDGSLTITGGSLGEIGSSGTRALDLSLFGSAPTNAAGVSRPGQYAFAALPPSGDHHNLSRRLYGLPIPSRRRTVTAARGIWHFKKRQHEQGNRELFVADSQNATLVRDYDESSPITGLRAYIADGTNLTMKATTNSEIVAKVLRTNFRCWGSSAITAAAPGPVEIFGGDLTLGASRPSIPNPRRSPCWLRPASSASRRLRSKWKIGCCYLGDVLVKCRRSWAVRPAIVDSIT